MQMPIIGAKDRVWPLQRVYFQAMNAAWCGYLTKSKPCIAINRLHQWLKQHPRPNKMKDSMQ